MNIKTNLFDSTAVFYKIKHHLPTREDYVCTKRINKIKNTPVIPSFSKKIIHAFTFLFHKLEVKFLIRDIKNNKLSSFIDINKHDDLFNEIDIKINKIKEEVKIEGNESKVLYDSFGIHPYYVDSFAKDEINKKEMEIEALIKEKQEIKNKNLNAINNIISHANDKFDFYSFCDYLTEVKRAKDFFSSLNDAEQEYSASKLIVEDLNEIIKHRLNAIDDKSIRNIFELINLKFKFENMHLNKKYDFMHNFSNEKERDRFIKLINLFLISIDEVQILNKFDNNIKNEMKYKLSTIMMIALEKNSDSECSFDSLRQEWSEKYIGDTFKFVTESTTLESSRQPQIKISADEEMENIIEIPMKSSNNNQETNLLIDKYNNIDEYEAEIKNYVSILKNKISDFKGHDKLNNELEWDDNVNELFEVVENNKIDDPLTYKINNTVLNSNDGFERIKDKIDDMLLDLGNTIDDKSISLPIIKIKKFSADDYKITFDDEVSKSEEDKN
ncbi:hypothetical protein [Proteus sp. FME41]|uniref:hypothetical protein n=1 Tax=Proteus sp. FME41 TaxID=2742608 RepID=UPI001866534E|nr:hypothetical protein [Proteus sp. FME41]